MENKMSKLLKGGQRDIVVIRHGTTAMNVKDVIRGWSDVPLSDEGFEECEKLGKSLKGKPIDGLVTSDLLRVLQTTLCVSRESGLPIISTTSALRPWNVGKLTGQDSVKTFPILTKYATEKPDEELEGGESFNSFKYRCLVGVISILNNNPGKTLALVTHHRGERLINAWIDAGCPCDLEIDFDTFLQRGEDPATAQNLTVSCNLLV
jgi:broad specificity phosphatase PhoE